MSSPSTNLVPTPAPNPLYPGVSNSYMEALTNSGLAGTAASTLSSAAAGTLPSANPAQIQSMEQQLQQFQTQGATNLKEQFGSKGLETSSDLDKAGALYEASSSADMGSLLENYQLQVSGQQTQAAEAALGLEEPAAQATYAPSTLVTGQSALQSIIGGVGAGGSLLTGLALAGIFG